MRKMIGALRLFIAVTAVLVGGAAIVLFSYTSLQIGRYSLSFWVFHYAVRFILYVLNVRVIVSGKEKLRQTHGFVIANHISYLDILVLVSIAPARFVAKDEISAWPVIGRIARAIGCVFVRRSSKESRQNARMALAAADWYPPIVIFAEGKRGPGTELLPFRYGAFEIAVKQAQPLLPGAIVYDPLQIAIWQRREPLIQALWRLVCAPQGVRASVYWQDPVIPQANSNAIQLSLATHDLLAATLEEKQYQKRLPARGAEGARSISPQKRKDRRDFSL
jgi:1-acyl-sn-glycerol-3-phosphate acyltransferase